MKLNHNPATLTVQDLLTLFQLSEKNLYKFTNRPKHYYRTFSIPKRTGGFRTIEAPTPLLKKIQHQILENFLAPHPVSRFAKAYKKGATLKEMARFHVNQQMVVRIDLTDFFGSLKEASVFRFFRQQGYSETVTVILTKLVTYRGGLPQGAPTSPTLSNILMRKIDERIARYCSEKKIRYTRYADDLVFSGDFSIKRLLAKLHNILAPQRLLINNKKTRVMRRHSTQMVTGLVVNDKLGIARNSRRRLRQELYYSEKFGVESHTEAIGERRSTKTYAQVLEGRKLYFENYHPPTK
ncbi:retron St85 family RNA-directed DNA polymerase [Chryseomicrobium imtechense]